MASSRYPTEETRPAGSPPGKAVLPELAADPEIAAAVADVDRSLLAWFLTLSPLERLQYVTRQTRAICEARAAATKR